MALRTAAPFISVLSRVNRKVLSVVVNKLGRFPAHVVIMTKSTVHWESALTVVRVGGGIVIRKVTTHAFRRCIGIVTSRMTLRAAYTAVPTFKWEKQVKVFTTQLFASGSWHEAQSIPNPACW